MHFQNKLLTAVSSHCAAFILLVLLPGPALAQIPASPVTGEPCRFLLDPLTFDAPEPYEAFLGCPTAPGGDSAAGAPPAAGGQATGEDAKPKAEAPRIPSNPNASSGLSSSGNLQKSVGLPLDAPLQVGGAATFVANRLTSGGLKTYTNTAERVFGFNAALDMERLFPFASIPGGELYASMIQYEGGRGPAYYTGDLLVYDSVFSDMGKRKHLLELYEVWWRQRLFDDRLIVKVGKIMAAGEFGTVLAPAPQDASRMGWAISNLLFVPIGYNPPLGGHLPAYTNTAWGAVVTVQPTPNLYGKYGFFDGNGIRYATGPRLGPDLNENIFEIGEAGAFWDLGGKGGHAAAGIWGQTGILATGMPDVINGGVIKEHGARGLYALANQRLWYLNDVDPRGLVGWSNFGYSPSQTSFAQHYLGGGLTALGLIPLRPIDTISFGVAWARLNQGSIAGITMYGPVVPPSGWQSSPFDRGTHLNSTERMYQLAYRFNFVPGIAFDAGYTAIPNPGARPNIPWANVFSLRMYLVF